MKKTKSPSDTLRREYTRADFPGGLLRGKYARRVSEGTNIVRLDPAGVRIIRELQGFSQNQLAHLTGIPQTTISAIENERVRLGVERAKVLARALKCHPAVLVFPGWDLPSSSVA